MNKEIIMREIELIIQKSKYINFIEKITDYVLSNFELKRKKLKVKIKHYSASWLNDGFCIMYDKMINPIKITNTKQEAIDFCKEHGLEIVDE